MQPQCKWPLIPNAKHIMYLPEPLDSTADWLHPFLGYPLCPILGRYNKGEYRLSDVEAHFEFSCLFSAEGGRYRCGDTLINIPEPLVTRLQTIPHPIPFNRPKNMKNLPDFDPFPYSPLPAITFHWVISTGPLGNGTHQMFQTS